MPDIKASVGEGGDNRIHDVALHSGDAGRGQGLQRSSRPEGLRREGQVPRHPEQTKRDALASATTSRTLIRHICSAQHEIGGESEPAHSQKRLAWIRWTTSLIIG
jgi:hypothetical protein